MHRALRSPARDASGAVEALLAALAVAGRVLAGAAIVEAIAISSFGLVAGTAIAVPVSMVMGIAYLALRPGYTRLRRRRALPRVQDRDSRRRVPVLHSTSRVAWLRDRPRPKGRFRDVTLEANTVVDVRFAEIDPIFFHPDGLPLWDESVARVELLSAGPLRTGFRFDTIGPRREKRSSYVATELTPTMWRTKLINSRVLAEAVWTMQFEPLNDQTRVTCTVDMRFRRWCTPLALLFRRLTPGMNRDMRLLKHAIEQRHAA